MKIFCFEVSRFYGMFKHVKSRPERLNTKKQPGIILFNTLKPCDVLKGNSVLIGSSQISTTSG